MNLYFIQKSLTSQYYAVFYVFCWSCKNIFAPKCSSSTVNNNKQISIFCCNYRQPSLLNYKFQVDKDYVQSSHYYASPTSRVNKNACGMNIFYLLFIKNSLYLQVIKSDFYLRNEFRNRQTLHLPLLGISSISQGLIFSVSPLSQLKERKTFILKNLNTALQFQ